MHTNIGNQVTISPPVWPGKELKVHPGDLSLFVPNGIGMESPMIMQPWDKPEDMLNRNSYYGFRNPVGHPVLDAPTNCPTGGTVYLDGGIGNAQFDTLMQLMGVHKDMTKYAAFLGMPEDPQRDNYVVQLRIVSDFALYSMFQAIDNEALQSFPEQPISAGSLLQSFIVDQQDIWGTGMGGGLSGALGGDGDWAKESLAFGFMVENEYNRVYRIWSRAWLVTK